MSLAVTSRGQGPDLVLLHGWGMNSAVWTDLSARLEATWRVHRVDLPGHGESPWNGEETLNEWTDAVARSVPENALWVGWSLGGQVALEAALQGHPRAVLVIAANPCFSRRDGWPCALAPDVLVQFAEDLLEDPEGTLRRFLALQFPPTATGRTALRTLRQALSQRGRALPEALRAGLRLLETVDLRAHLPAIEVPLAWLLGGRDRLVPPALTDCLPQLRPADPVRLIPEAGHAPFLTHPKAFLAILEGSIP